MAEFIGILKFKFPIQVGVSAKTGNNWESQEIEVVTNEERPQTGYFKLFGAKADQLARIPLGVLITVSYSLHGKRDKSDLKGWNSLDAWKVEVVGSQSPVYNPVAPVTQSIPQPAQDTQGNQSPYEPQPDDLPF